MSVLDKYHTSKFSYRSAELAHRISSMDTLVAFLSELVDLGYRESMRIKTRLDADWAKDVMNNPTSEFNSLLNVQSYHQNIQEFDYIPSNLGKGFIFYFICDRCEKRVKYLYMTHNSNIYLCRKCSRIPYVKKRSKSRPASHPTSYPAPWLSSKQ